MESFLRHTIGEKFSNFQYIFESLYLLTVLMRSCFDMLVLMLLTEVCRMIHFTSAITLWFSFLVVIRRDDLSSRESCDEQVQYDMKNNEESVKIKESVNL